MMNTSHNSYWGRLAVTLLFVLGAIGFLGGSAVIADEKCDDHCLSPLLDEVHVPDTTINPDLCDPAEVAFCPWPWKACGEGTVKFYDHSVGYIDTWEWDFGDPASGADNYATGEYVSHFYAQPGVYNVTLTVTGCGGTVVKADKSTVVVLAYPEADFSADPTRGCQPTTVQFTDLSTGALEWFWQFGDGATSTDQHPSHTYTTPGVYTVSLRVRGECGKAEEIKEEYITIGVGPEAEFTADQTDFCEGADVSFTNLSVGATSWLWDFGDGTGSSDQHPVHAYTIAGVYTVTLTASNDCGDDTAVKEMYITVRPGPQADFSVDVTDLCIADQVVFTDLSAGALTWEWDFGDGGVSDLPNPTHIYVGVGVYTVTLSITGDCGEDTEVKTALVTVSPPPVADFYSNREVACVGADLNFTDMSQYATTWAWDFGDGATSSAQNPSHVYTAEGLYTVSLRVTNLCGDDEEVKEEYIRVLYGPEADFSVDVDNLCADNQVQFTDLSTNALSWFWDFGDGTTSSSQSPSHVYPAPGTFTVSLTVANDCGDDTETKQAYVTVWPTPTADFYTDQEPVCTGAEVFFTDLSIAAETWSWDFGDGGTSSAQNPSHVYTAEGVYSITLHVTNRCGEDEVTRYELIHVFPAPIADFHTVGYEGCVGETVFFINESQNAYSWHWEFGDGQSSSDENPGHFYSVPGAYTVELTAYNACGSDKRTRYEYIVIHGGPMADFEADPTNACVGSDVQFTDLSIDAEAWFWSFGDGGTSSDQNPSHAYLAPGFYTVRLEVSNRCGEDDEVKEDYVYIETGPTAEFTSEVDAACVESEVSFTNLSTNSLAWLWDFGDGNTSGLEHPTHSYAAPGLYTISLTAYNDCGQDTETKTEYLTVHPAPLADFIANPIEGCAPLTVAFADLSQYAMSWYWEFGDGQNSYERHPTHTYDAPGVYSVRLRVSNNCGDDTYYRENLITVDRMPVADFTADVTEICAGEVIHFTDLSTDARTWWWEFGDNSFGTSPNVNHTYNTPGLYTVYLTVTNACGSDAEGKFEYVLVHPKPVADFVASPLRGCTGTIVEFTSTATDAETWYWEFGDGDYSYDQHPSHTYTTAGVYAVMHRVTNDCGQDEKVRTEYITIADPPMAAFTVDPYSGCVENDFHFQDMSTNATSWLWDFGDGLISMVQSPTHSYALPGVYTVSLTVANACGDDTEVKTDLVTVHGGPTADFTASVTSGYVPLTVDFTDLSSSEFTIASWAWKFGDGATSDLQHPTHVYTATGLYTVELTVTDQCGSDVATKLEYIYVSDECVVDFYAEPTHGCAGSTVYFGGTTTGLCNVTAWNWDFGDPNSGANNSATGQNVQHTYNSAGSFTVTLTAVEAGGNQVVTKTNFVTIEAGPDAAFSANPTSGAAPLIVSFTDQTVSTAGNLTWSWNFGDPTSGSNNGSTDQNPYHTFSSEGNFTVTLTAGDDCGTDTYSVVISVGPALTISKMVDKPVAPVGEELTYTLTVHNNAAVAIYDVYVVDTVPDSTSFVSGSATQGGMYDSRTDLVFWTIGSIAAGGSETVAFRVVLDGPFFKFPTIIGNIATATFDDDGIATALRTFVSNRVETVVDQTTGLLTVTKAVSASLASPGDDLTYTITVRNTGPSPAMNLTVRDAIPDMTAYVPGSITGAGVYKPTNDSLLWGLGTLGGFQSIAVTFDVTIGAGCADGTVIPNTALATSSLGGERSNEVLTEVNRLPMVIRKTTNTPSGRFGDLLRFSITVENFSGQLLEDVVIRDTMPIGIFYVEGTSKRDGGAIADPATALPILEWNVGDLVANASLKLDYTALVGNTAQVGMNQNVARSRAVQGGVPIYSNRALADIYIVSYTITGAIRGKVVVDCDGDGVADMEPAPHGMDVYLDDGSQSRVNEAGMFYFSTVRPGERVVALDERDLDGFYVPEGAQSSVFVHVHENGESYVIFRICPDYPHLEIEKQAAIVPKVKVTKQATVNSGLTNEGPGVVVDYIIDIRSNGRTEPTPVRVIDSLPSSVELLTETAEVEAKRTGDKLVYEVTAAREKLRESVKYSLRDLAPGERQFLTNTVYAQGDLPSVGDEPRLINAEPIAVEAGPLVMAPPVDLKITLTPALFITSKAFLQPPAIPQLHAVADSIMKYADADVKVEGHTDFRPIHNAEFPSNWELGEARAKAVVDWLVANRQIDPDRLVYESFAATVPVVVDVPRTSEALQPNRRTEVIIQGKAGGAAIDMAAVPTEGWVKSTVLYLDPVDFAYGFESVDPEGLIDLDDSWEVRLAIVNISNMAATGARLSDILPEGVMFVEGSARVAGQAVAATVEGNTIKLTIDNIEPKQRIEISYRVELVEGSTASGGGAASVEVMSTTGLPIVQQSNEIHFE